MSRYLSTCYFLVSLLPLACASTPGKEERVVINEPPPRPALKVVRREPGSLWSEDSRWNDIYAVAPSRVMGDTVRVKISPELREKIGRISEPKTLGSKKESTAQEALEKQMAQEKTVAAAREDSQYMEASIIEVLPRGLFAVRALQTIRVGAQETRVELIGNVREKDIDQSDTVTSEALLNLNLNASIAGKAFQPIDTLDRNAAGVAASAASNSSPGEKK